MLIRNTEELKKFVNVNVSLAFADIEIHLKKVVKNVIIEAIGKQQYDVFVSLLPSDSSGSGSASSSASGSSSADSDIIGDVIEQLQYAEANLAMYLWTFTGGLQFSSMGMTRIENVKDGAGKKSAFQYQEKEARDHFKESGYSAIDIALSIMDKNLSSFEKFANSDNFSKFRGSIIYTPEQFNAQYDIGRSYLLYAKLKQNMQAVEDFHIAPAIGMDLIEKLKQEVLKTSDFNNDILALLPYARKAIAFLAVKEQLMMPGEFTDKGVIFDTFDTVTGNMNKRVIGESGQISARINQAALFGRNYLEQLKTYLLDNISKYPDYAAHIGISDNNENIESTNGKIIVL